MQLFCLNEIEKFKNIQGSETKLRILFRPNRMQAVMRINDWFEKRPKGN